MASLLSNFVKELTKLSVKIAIVFLNSKIQYDNLIKCKYPSCNKDYSKKIDGNLKNGLRNAFKFSYNINKFILLIRKGGRVASWLVTCDRKPKVPGSSPAAIYVLIAHLMSKFLWSEWNR